LKLDPVDFSLRLVDDGRPVAVVFNQVLMLGASPTHMELAARLMIERSTAIKAPTLAFALSHSKKIQQVLTRPGMVERFFSGPNEAHMAAQIRKTFAGLWGFEADQTKNNELIQMAIKNPERFVLKPIGEGCGAHFNYFDDDIPKKLAKLSPTELTEFILMEKLKPKVYKNHLVRALRPTLFNTEVTPELGIYGSLIGDMTTGRILYNKQEGHTFKTKLATENEGGICSGTGAVDAPFLVDN
uniref:Glutathione synthase n=1 Tax=Globodera pallida TaxID=36090 RepID=A0A183CPN9_GLOPA